MLTCGLLRICCVAGWLLCCAGTSDGEHVALLGRGSEDRLYPSVSAALDVDLAGDGSASDFKVAAALV